MPSVPVSRYSGAYRDPVLGGYPLGNGYRIYLPWLSRFSAPDNQSPFGKGGINPYAYCAGDPINYRDASGHFGIRGLLDEMAEAVEMSERRGVSLEGALDRVRQTRTRINYEANFRPGFDGDPLAIRPREQRVGPIDQDRVLRSGRGARRTGRRLAEAHRVAEGLIRDIRTDVTSLEMQTQVMEARISSGDIPVGDEQGLDELNQMRARASTVRANYSRLRDDDYLGTLRNPNDGEPYILASMRRRQVGEALDRVRVRLDRVVDKMDRLEEHFIGGDSDDSDEELSSDGDDLQ
jgi:RHS repeat-associated protein